MSLLRMISKGLFSRISKQNDKENQPFSTVAKMYVKTRIVRNV